MRDAQTVEPYYSRAVWTPISSLPPDVHFSSLGELGPLLA